MPSSPPNRRGLAAGAAAAVVLVGAGLVAAAAASPADGPAPVASSAGPTPGAPRPAAVATSAPPTTATVSSQEPADALPGADGPVAIPGEDATLDLSMVIGPDGRPAGYLDGGAAFGDVPLEVGSDAGLRGQVVRRDRDGGPIVGYLITGSNGFVTVEQLADPASLAEIEQRWRADQEAATGEPGA